DDAGALRRGPPGDPGLDRRGVDSRVARVRARRGVPPGAAAGREGPGADPPDPGDRPHGPRGPADDRARHPAAGPDHPRQRARQGQRRRVLPCRRCGVLGGQGGALPRRHLADLTDDASLGAREGRARHAPVRARGPQRGAAADHRRADRPVGREGQRGRDQGRRDPERDAARDGAPGGGRARAPREGHPRRGRVPGVAAARRRRRGAQPAPRRAATALPPDAHRSRRQPELDDRLPAPDRRHTAVPPEPGGNVGSATGGRGRTGRPARRDGRRRCGRAAGRRGGAPVRDRELTDAGVPAQQL
ncbi:MAG: Putative stomatin/prohibitin-family membrane protease subunit aq_911, partial [uncultured Solirubrobacteraceae bacterium]